MHALLGMTIQGVFSTTNGGLANMYHLMQSVVFIVSAVKVVLSSLLRALFCPLYGIIACLVVHLLTMKMVISSLLESMNSYLFSKVISNMGKLFLRFIEL